MLKLCCSDISWHGLQCFRRSHAACMLFGHTSAFRSSEEQQKLPDVNEFPRAYEPAWVEQRWMSKWDAGGGKAMQHEPANTFSMVLPPPNVTGKLHLGHALTLSIQDAICRWRRMCGDRVVWVPGTDHAGIATQVMVEKALWAEERTTRHQLGREEFLKRVWKWRSDRSDQIHSQMKALGVTLDWNRGVFTMDPCMSEAVTEAFVRLFDAGLVYRAEALVNWCCHLQSAVSDIEVEHRTVEGTMVDIAYRWDEDPSQELVVSTTRPETLLGDTGVAVCWDDPRLRHWVGRRVRHPLRPGRPLLPVVADHAVKPEFGTGALKITPAHDPIDFEVGRRHNLELLNILTEDGHINENGGQFQGLTRGEARLAVVDALKQLGLYRGDRQHHVTVPICSRTGDVIEPMVKHQWFVRCREMAAEALSAVQEGELTLDPPSLTSSWQQWLGDTRDWCVSRQLWWGHRIPVFCVTVEDGRQHWVAAASQQDALSKLGLAADEVTSVRQDDDVMDTWFSSALFPFVVFGWPRKTADLERCYPLSLMETGHDILFFWVARMVMLGKTLTGQLPFKRVLLHGLVCDAHGRKMSKSLGNVIDPDQVIQGATLDQLHQQVDTSALQGYISPNEADKAKEGQRALYPDGIPACGADALRFSLCSTNVRENFVSLDVREARQARLFGNKLWQATRFALTHLEENHYHCPLETRLTRLREVSGADRWMLSCLGVCVESCSAGMQTLQLHTVTGCLHQMFYRQFCDVYLEVVKPVLRSDCADVRRPACDVMLTVLETGMLLLHPIMPHLTEELASRLTAHSGQTAGMSLHRYPAPEQWLHWRDAELESSFITCLDAVRGVRALKAKYRLTKTAPEVHLETEPALTAQLEAVVSTLARCRVRTGPKPIGLMVQGHRWRAHVQLQGHVDVASELEMLRTKMERLEKKISISDAVMKTKKFARRSGIMKDQERKRKSMMEDELNRLRECKEDMKRLS